MAIVAEAFAKLRSGAQIGVCGQPRNRLVDHEFLEVLCRKSFPNHCSLLSPEIGRILPLKPPCSHISMSQVKPLSGAMVGSSLSLEEGGLRLTQRLRSYAVIYALLARLRRDADLPLAASSDGNTWGSF